MTLSNNWNRRLRSSMGLVCFALAVNGCGAKAPNYTPNLQTAETAVRRGLDQWKAGQPPGEVPDTHPLIHVTDGGRKPGQTLESYQILGETRGVSGRTIAVTLHLANPNEEVKARYIVLGIDPLLVFRQEDFDLLMHWDHHMPAPTAADASGVPSSTSEISGQSETQAITTPDAAEAPQ